MGDREVVLAWDTCSEDGVISVCRGRELLGSSRFRTVKGHAGWLMPLIDTVVSSAHLEPGDIDAVAAGIGPGGYTGVKVGVSTAKAMALALGVPLLGVPALDLMAAHAPREAGPLLCCIDARQGLVYAATYSAGGDSPRRTSDYLCVEPQDAAELVRGLKADRVTALGFVPGETAGAARGAGVTLEVVSAADAGFPSAERLAALALAAISRGDAGDAFDVLPIYLKKAV